MNMRQLNISTVFILLCCFLLLPPTTFSSPIIRRLPSVVKKVNQVARQLKQNHTDFAKEIAKIKKQTDKMVESDISMIQNLTKADNKNVNGVLANLDNLVTKNPPATPAQLDDIVNLINRTKTFLQTTTDQYDLVMKHNAQLDATVSELNRILPGLTQLQPLKNAAYLKLAREASEKARIIEDTFGQMSNATDRQNIEIAYNFISDIVATLATSTNHKDIKEKAELIGGVVNVVKENITAFTSINNRSTSMHNANKSLLDPDNGKIAEISKKLDELATTQQPLDKLLAEAPIDLNVEAADTLLRNAKGYALNLAEENGITELKLDNGGIKDILDNHINLNEYKIEHFSLEDMEVALRNFSSEEEVAFVETLGTNWRQYLFVIENSKIRDGERLLSMEDLEDSTLIQDFVARYLDNLNEVVPEYEHRLPANLFDVHRHDGNIAQILKHSETYSQQLGELKANAFLNNEAKERFLRALEDLRQANDEDSLLDLYDKPAEELAVYRQIMEDELASIDKSIDNISNAYAERLKSLYDEELHAYESALGKVSSKTDAKLANLDKQYNRQEVPIRQALPATKQSDDLLPEKLTSIRNLTIELVDQHKDYKPGSKTIAEMGRLYVHLGWEIVKENRNHPYLIKTIFNQEFKISLPRASGDISKGVAGNVFKQVRGLHIAE
ncbi:MAG: hypothetical protein OYH77_07595, partial [Pseudomonadota bacterium]|nr:hypothetical protein [Pseudomonadota bacterium]